MNSRLSRFLLIAVVSSSLTAALGCSTGDLAQHDLKNNDSIAQAPVAALNEETAVAAVLRDHPDYPQPGVVVPLETMTGGPAPGVKVTGQMTTTVEKMPDEQRYRITLKKDWNMIFSDTKVEGVWVYEVKPDGTQLIRSENNESLLQLIK